MPALADLAEDVGERLAGDELHRVEVDAAFGADSEDGNDVRVMQMGRRLGLVAETLEMLGVEGGGERQHLQGDAPAERELDRLVDDPHAAAADLADDLEVAQRLAGDGVVGGGVVRLDGCEVRGARLMHEVESREAIVERGGDVRILSYELRPVRTFPLVEKLEVSLHRAEDARIVGEFGVRRRLAARDGGSGRSGRRRHGFSRNS